MGVDVVDLSRPLVAPSAAHRRALWIVGVSTTGVLLLTAGSQIYDANLYILAEATSLLAGDQPGRDFFRLGAPLEAYAAAAAQLASGGRLIGEFVRQWSYIVAGVVIAFHLGLRSSRSIPATLAMLVPTLIILANTPPYHAPKLLFFPLFIWVAWRYLENPTPWRCAVVGGVTALAFLARHDYGPYLGFGSVLTILAARMIIPASRDAHLLLRDVGFYAVTVVTLIAPWAISVQATEGLVEFTRARVALYPTPQGSPYTALLELNPIRELTPQPLPSAKAGIVRFVWQPGVDASRQRELEAQYRLRPLEGRDNEGRLQYEVPNLFDAALLELDQFIRAPAGFEFDRIRQAQGWLPSDDSVALWLEQVALAVPLICVGVGGWTLWRGGHSVEAWQTIVAGAVLAVIHQALFRGPGYMVVAAPLIAALSARFVSGPGAVARTIAVVVLILTTFAAGVWARRAPIFQPSELAASVRTGFRQLIASPPVDAEPSYRYLYECTVPGDRLLITGSTPALVSYYANRPVAGGHSYWHLGWLSSPVYEARSLALLQQQSVPFVVSTHDPVLDDFRKYPHIRAYLEQNYSALDGTNGRMLVDTRRHPVRQFGPRAYPCFK